MTHEAISVFDIFKIGVGPSSSHTLGPWKAALRFLQSIQQTKGFEKVEGVKIFLYGSLAKTGKGHGTDLSLLLGLSGKDPVLFNVDEIDSFIKNIVDNKLLNLGGACQIPFNAEGDIVFLFKESLPYHPNALTFVCSFLDGDSFAETYYSVGGGFVIKEGEEKKPSYVEIPFPVNTASDLLHWCMKTGLNIHEIVLENEMVWLPEREVIEKIMAIWKVMQTSVYTGCHTAGELPGGLGVKRRAAEMNKKLLGNANYDDYEGWVKVIKEGGTSFQYILDWVSCFALAVNEQNAAFGRVVTAPTNGAAGVVPAVLMYYLIFEGNSKSTDIIPFLLTASEIGSIFKKGATLSAAMGGCQAEIGVSSAMAAAALTERRGGTQRQVLMAAEIAMEHHLGMTCDPIGGLVQVPCIERNAMGAIKAITASQLALQSAPDFAKVSLDAVIQTMWQTALDMNSKYKETSEGGLAVAIPISLSEC